VPGSNFWVGKINVESVASAAGIELLQPSTITVTKDIVATSTGATGTGMVATGILSNGVAPANQNITIDTKDGDVQISGIITNGATPFVDVAVSVDLASGNNDTLTITGTNKHTNKGKEFTVIDAENTRWETDAEYASGSYFIKTLGNLNHQVATGKTVVLTDNGIVAADAGNYNFGSAVDNKSAGTLVTKFLSVNGNVVVNNGLLALDGSNPNVITGNLTIGNNNPNAQASAAVALYGNTLAGRAIGFVLEQPLHVVALP
jgi:hypothetical protein